MARVSDPTMWWVLDVVLDAALEVSMKSSYPEKQKVYTLSVDCN
jgi:hypothetical protein